MDKNNDGFAWSSSDLIGVSRQVIEDKLQVNQNAKPQKMSVGVFAPARYRVVKITCACSEVVL
jgi:hypothetical protein